MLRRGAPPARPAGVDSDERKVRASVEDGGGRWLSRRVLLALLALSVLLVTGRSSFSRRAARPPPSQQLPPGAWQTAGEPLRYLFMVERMGSDYWSCHYRVMQILEDLRGRGRPVTLVVTDECPSFNFLRRLVALDVDVRCHAELPDFSLEPLLAEKRFDVAVFMLWMFNSPNVAELYVPQVKHGQPEARVLVVTDDYHWMREQSLQTAASHGNAVEKAVILRWEDQLAVHEKPPMNVDVQTFKIRELIMYCWADAVATITPEDAHLTGLDLPQQTVLPLRMATLGEAARTGGGFHDRYGILFEGNGFNPTNWVSMRWFLEHVMPVVWSHPNGTHIQLTVVGAVPQKPNGWSSVAQRDPRVTVLGRVQEVEPHLFETRVFVSPIVAGTGLNVKNLLPLQHGVPLVTTLIGAEGLGLMGDGGREADGRGAYVATSIHDMADAIVRLHSDESEWEVSAERGVRHAREHLSAAAVRQDAVRIERALAALPSGPSNRSATSCERSLWEHKLLRAWETLPRSPSNAQVSPADAKLRMLVWRVAWQHVGPRMGVDLAVGLLAALFAAAELLRRRFLPSGALLPQATVRRSRSRAMRMAALEAEVGRP